MVKLPKDRLLHFGVGTFISIGGTLFAEQIGWSPVLGFMLAIVAGVLKEVKDEYTYDGGDFVDLFATALGAAFGVFIFTML